MSRTEDKYLRALRQGEGGVISDCMQCPDALGLGTLFIQCSNEKVLWL